jgi:hypothetical protein
MLTFILAAFGFCFVLERVNPGWPLPQVRTWPLRVLLINGVQLRNGRGVRSCVLNFPAHKWNGA